MNNGSAAENDLIVRHLSTQPYEKVWREMKRFTDMRTSSSVDELWTVQHPPVFTQGQAGKAKHILSPGDIPVIQVDRGGQVTYHGPGQLIIYFLIDLRRKAMGVRELVNRIEASVIALLNAYDLEANSDPHAPGVYINSNKIASLGLRIRKGCSYHGLSLNVDMDLEPFSRINPCGYKGLSVIQLKDFVPTVYVSGLNFINRVENQLLSHLTAQLAYNVYQDSNQLPDKFDG